MRCFFYLFLFFNLYKSKKIDDSDNKYPTIEVINKGIPFLFEDTNYHEYSELKGKFKPKSEGGPKNTSHIIDLYSIFGGKTAGLGMIDSNKNFKILFRNNEKGESVVSLSRITPIGESDNRN